MVNGIIQMQIYFTKQHLATKTKKPFNVSNFWGDFYEVQKKGTGYVMGTLEEWRKLVLKGLGYLMPFIVRRTKAGRIDVGLRGIKYSLQLHLPLE